MFFGKKREKNTFEKNGYTELYGEEIRERIGETEKILAVVRYLADGLLIFDANARISLINPQAEKFFEVNKKEVLKKSIFELNRFPNFRPLVSLLGGEMKEVFRKDLQIRENFVLQVTITSMIVGEKKVGALVILHDVTKEKLVERMKSDFVTLAAHQLRTPTSAVKWSMKMLLDGDLGKINEKQKEIIGKAYKTNNRTIKLVNDLLDVAQIEEGKYLSKTKLSNIKEVIQSVVDDYKEKLKERKLRLEIKNPEEQLPKVMIDVEKMKIVVKNIVDNAVRYTLPNGKISITIKSDKKEIEIRIQDTGLGIPQNQQGEVFTRFFRGANIMKIDTEGTGLGLYLTKNIIEAHGGRIWFESKENKGTTFYFTIPLKEKYGEFLTEEFY